ncbi:MAG: hypothetical protein IPG58_19940 [Acidobacteria bacterium]|nr:hypothetical protein [Acidobacteriota bacterium]
MMPDDRRNSGSEVRSIAYSPDGNTIATADEYVRLWNAITGRYLRTLASGTSVSSVAFSPDGKIVAGGGNGTYDEEDSGAVYLWNLQTGKLIRKMTNLNSYVSSVTFSPVGNILAGASSDIWLRSTKNLSLLQKSKP